jgi:uroporphyrinogen-III synthase
MLPLQGKRILVTRTRRQASGLAEQLQALGAAPILIPAIEIVPPESYIPLDSALAQLDAFDWLIFTSANAVEVFNERWKPHSHVKLPKIAAIGPATAKAIQAIGLHVDVIPPRYVAESLAETLVPEAVGRRVLLIRAEDGRDVLLEALERSGARVTIAPAYRNQIPGESVSSIRRVFSSPDNYPHAITLTSASTARGLISLLDAAGQPLPSGIALASIGPITSQAMRELGYKPTIEAREATIPALIEALGSLFIPSA